MNKSYYLFLIIILLLFINGCEEENQIQPTFQGVIISRNADPIVPIAYEIDQEDPYHNFDNEKIEDKIRKRIQLPITNTCDFYVDAEEELYLIIKVYNPEEYDILSCVINDVRYQSYQFTSKSNYQNIIIPFNSKKEAGKVVLKVNEIQYSDGNKLKEIIILENNSVSYGVNYQKSPSEKTDKMAVKATSVSFEFTVSDSEGLIERAGNILKVFLYDGKDIIYENDLLLGVNEIEFNNLKSNTLYQFAIITVYDLVDGEGLNLVVLHKEAFYTQKLLQLISVTPTADEISFELQINDQDSEGIISALELYKGKELIASISKDLRVFTSLESNTDYQLKIVYSYGEGLEEVLEVALKTHKQEASVDVEIYDLGKTSFSYQFLIVDEDLVSKITKIALYLDKQLIETKDFEAEPCFVELLSNRIYCLEVTYVYDLADGKGEQTKTCSKEVNTSHLLVPEVIIENTQVSVDEISFEIITSDFDEILNITSVSLYEKEELVINLEDYDNLKFSSLKTNTRYQIRLTYTYDLNDGSGIKEKEVLQEVSTLALPIEITDFALINQSIPRVGQEVYARVTFNNPSKVDLLSFTINEEEVATTLGKDKNNAVISFLPETAGGNYEICINAFTYQAFEKNYTSNLTNDFKTEILILGNLEVESIYVSEDKIGVEEATPILIEFNNETDYQIFEIVLGFQGKEIVYQESEILSINSNLKQIVWKEVVLNYQEIFQLLSVKRITYGLGLSDTSTKSISNIEAEVIVLKTLERQYISTYQELRALEDGYHYQLCNDLDLFQIVWEPLSFNGILDGAGYAIKNLSLAVENETTQEQRIGFFADFNGIIMNLNLQDLYFSVSSKGKVIVASFIGKSTKAQIYNCSINGVINVSSKEIVLGGLIGEAETVTSIGNLIQMDILGSATNKINIAGIVGKSGDISASGNLFLGVISGKGEVSIDGISNGKLNAKNNYFSYNSKFYLNNLKISLPRVNYVSLENLNNKTFYLNNLNWSEEIWDFSNLDYEAGSLPILR